jgi:hypothetical protein
MVIDDLSTFVYKRYMRSGPILAMVWTGLNIVPMVRAMVGATRPVNAAPGSVRGDLCIDVGRNLIHASDSSEAAQKEVAMWFPNEQIVQWRPSTVEWTYEDEEDETTSKPSIKPTVISPTNIRRYQFLLYHSDPNPKTNTRLCYSMIFMILFFTTLGLIFS